MKALPWADLDQILDHTRPLWEQLRAKRILFTGASGFFGSWMLEAFLHANHELGLEAKAVAVTRSSARFAKQLPHLASHPQVEVLEADIATMPIPDGPIDFVIHSIVPNDGTSLAETESFFQAATQQLLNLAIQKNASAFLLCSTGAVYQPKDPPAPFAETDPLVPLDGPLSYGQIRRRVEKQCLEALEHSPVALKTARGFAFVGPRLPLEAHFAMGNFIRDALAGIPIQIKGDGSPLRSYLYAADLAVWLWTILLAGAPGRAFNVGGDEALSIADLAGRIDRLRPAARGLHIARAVDNSAPSRYVPDLTCARQELGLTPLVSLDDAIMRTLRWNEQP